jgi:hypothetical protein
MNIYKANLIHAVTLFICTVSIYVLTSDKAILMNIFVFVILLALNNGIQVGVTSQIKAAIVVALLGGTLLINPIEIAWTNSDHKMLILLGTVVCTLVLMTFYGLKFFFQKVKI